MVFSSPIFLFLFLPLSLLCYFLLPALPLRNSFLLMASLLFYAWGDSAALGLLLASIGGNYLLALHLDRSPNRKARKLWLSLAVIFNLGILLFFKYASFLGQNLNFLLNIFHIHSLRIPQVALPLGISFFTFHALSYVIDVFRQKTKAQSNLGNLALYIALFPQLVAGPIIRYHDIYQQLTERKTDLSMFADGIRRFTVGLGKKVLLANTLAGPTDGIFALNAQGQGLSLELAWLGALCYSLQIYFDFSGYSDMAIGLGLMFGFNFPENFNAPYSAQSIREFWHRWHISLSTWFRDYLYLPLGGSYGGKRSTIFNLFTVFLLCGLWHGASFNFLFWGLYHGLFLSLERSAIFKQALDKLWQPLRHFYTLLIILVGWVFFRTETMPQAFSYLHSMISPDALPWPNTSEEIATIFNGELILALLVAIALSFFNLFQFRTGQRRLPLQLPALCAIMILSVMKLAAGTYNPFIYFRF